MRRNVIGLSLVILVLCWASQAEEPQPAAEETVTEETVADEAAKKDDAKEEVTQDEPSGAEYSRLDENVAILASKTMWYLEELDADGRPSEGTYWKDGKISKRVSWAYYEGSERAKVKIETDDASTRETRYDERGNVISVTVMDAEDKILKSENYEYTEDNLVAVSRKEEKGLSTVIEYTYSRGKSVSSTKTSVNGKLVSTCAYANEFNWTETVFNEKGKAILVVDYKEGVRQVRR